jgi:hypothetical protein
MRKIVISVFALILFISCATSNKRPMGNMLAIMEVKEPIEGVCNSSKVVAILPFLDNGQVKAQAPLTDEQIIQKLNAEVDFLKDKPNYNDKGMVNLIINCEGRMVRCRIDNKTQNPILDQQIVDVFSEMVNWKAGTVNGKSVDTSVLYSFEIKNGIISL